MNISVRDYWSQDRQTQETIREKASPLVNVECSMCDGYGMIQSFHECDCEYCTKPSSRMIECYDCGGQGFYSTSEIQAKRYKDKILDDDDILDYPRIR